jgi:hypothetical protein
VLTPNPELARALRLAHDRLDGDSDAYADEDLLGQLVAAVDQALEAYDPRPILRQVARESLYEATSGHDPQVRLLAVRAAREALATLRELPAMTSPIAGEADHLRRELEAAAVAVAAARAERDSHFAMLDTLCGEFMSAETPGAARVASRIERHLATTAGAQPIRTRSEQ